MTRKPRRRFGSIRKRSSGRYQVRYIGPDGQERSAPETFERKSDADRYLSLIEAQLTRGEWIDPERSKIRLHDYAERWIAQRPNLRPRTVQLYTWLLGKHITPYIGAMPIGKLTTPMVREWRAALIANGVSQTMAAKAYRLLRAVLMTAVKEDELIRANPCRIPGADQEKTGERPVLTLAQVFQLSELMPDRRYRALILVAAFGCLRWGELAALQRQDIDTELGTVRVRQAYNEVRGVGLVLGPPKSRAGLRTVALPAAVLTIVRAHLVMYVGEEPTAHIFTGPNGLPIWRGNFNKLVKWRECVAAIGAPGLHFHDLRHTGNTIASKTGASLRDLMARMGHDNPRAAMIYQHASSEADQAIADAVSAGVEALREKQRKEREATQTKVAQEPDEGDDGAAGTPAKVG
jgi:integrase